MIRRAMVTRIVLSTAILLFLSICVSQVVQALTIARIDPWHESDFTEQNLDLIEACPQPHENDSEECLRGMDVRIRDWPLEFPDTTWISLPNRLTLGRALRDPIGDRARVVEALQQEECLLASGESVRWDLKDSCHADAFVNLSVFLWACNEPADLEQLHQDVVNNRERARQESGNSQRWKSNLQSSIIWLLRARWLNDKCDNYQVSDLWFDGRQDKEQHELLKATASRFGEIWGRPPHLPETFVLKALAARLGDESAAMQYHGPSNFRAKDDSWEKHINKVWPWRKAIRAIRGGGIVDGSRKMAKRLQLGVFIAVSLQDSNLEFDWNFLVGEVCEREKPEDATCQEAIAELKGSLDWDRKEELQALDKFETVSMELGLFD